ncbi:MAG: GSCFA domain-containing protein [Bacteroidota bacterium]
MQFRTELSLSPAGSQIQYDHCLLAIGSCFVEHIGQRLIDGKFNLRLNPFGISYNPIVLARQLDYFSGRREFPADDFFFHEAQYHHFDLHGKWNDPDLAEIGKRLSVSIDEAVERVHQADWLILTLGTAHVFHHLETNQVVNNCHRLPSQQFERRLLSVAEVVNALANTLKALLTTNSKLRVILTVSPVRYLRDGLVNSQRSKAHLITAVHQLCEELDRVVYFPAYELLIDDLRDYRFFDRDLAHPSAEAIDYVWEKFAEVYFSPETEKAYLEITKFRKLLQHRVRGSAEAQAQFNAQALEKLGRLKAKFPALNWSAEQKHLT